MASCLVSAMHETAGASIDRLVTRAEPTDLEVEFEARLADSGALAFRVAYGVLRHREDAEDVAQEALARAYRKLGTLRERERFRAWLVRICWRLARDRRRAAKRRERREQAVAGSALEPTAEDMAAANEFRGRLWQAIDELPEKLRVVLVLAGIEGYDVREVAALLELPPGTVKSRLFLARRRLAERLR
jgi:RNA polymerase sigma-70 factor (ECF subfamily)